MDRLQEFTKARHEQNRLVMDQDHLGIKRFFNLDNSAYRDGALSGKVKELLGLVSSTALRCNDCIDYHIIQSVDAGWSDEEIVDALNVALVVGGSITIPHLRHAIESLRMARDAAEQGG